MRFSLFLALIFQSSSLSKPILHLNQLIVWNVGQGSWATISSEERCVHFDVGGEFAPITKISEECSLKENYIFFSHWDWDHISFARLARKTLPILCMAAAPGGKGNKKKSRQFSSFKKCSSWPEDIQEVSFSTSRSTIKKLKTANAQSRIFTWRNELLVTGDSPKEAEEIWVNQLNNSRIKWLIAGHHGSRTSTSKELLNRLSELKFVIISARHKRYGHPHKEVLELIQKARIPLIKTEDWGNIHLLY